MSVLAWLAVLGLTACGESSGQGGGGGGGGGAGQGGSSSGGTAGTGGTKPATGPFSDTLCSEFVCWVDPLPQGNALRGIVATSSSIWAVGGGGTVLRRRDGVWQVASAPEQANLNAIWAASDDDVWAVGELGAIVHWDGKKFSSLPSGVTTALHGVWGNSPTDVWAVGDYGVILHWNGSAWTSSPGGTDELHAVWGSGPDDVWAVGGTLNVGTWEHWDGTKWSPSTTGLSGAGLYSIAGSGPDDVWSAGEYGQVYRYTSQGWVFDGQLPGNPRIMGLIVKGPGDLWANGGPIYHRTGPATYTAISGSEGSWYPLAMALEPGSDTFWLAGLNGGVAQFTKSGRKEELTAAALKRLLVASDDVVVSVGPDEAGQAPMQSWDGSKWVAMGKIDSYAMLSATTNGRVIMSQTDTTKSELRLRMLVGTTFQDLSAHTDPDLVGCTAVFGNSEKDIWAICFEFALHYDGLTWSRVDVPGVDNTGTIPKYPHVLAGAARSSDDQWIVGAMDYAGIVPAYSAHYDGKSWTQYALPGTEGTHLSNVAFIGTDAYAAGVFEDYLKGQDEGFMYYPLEPVLYKFTNGTWTKVPVQGATPQYHGTYDVLMAAAGSTLWYAPASQHPGMASLLSFDGTSWKVLSHPAETVTSLYATPSSLWLLGGSQMLGSLQGVLRSR